MVLHACRNNWKTLWTDSPNAFIDDNVFIEDVLPKRIEPHENGLIFKILNFDVGEVLRMYVVHGSTW